MGQRVLLTGGAGFFGRHVCCRLLRHGHRVTVLDRLPAPAWAVTLGIPWVQCDITDASAVARAVAGADSVVHAAFAPPHRTPEELRRVNLDGTGAVLRAARQDGTAVVLVSSTIVERHVPPHPLLPSSPQSRLHAYAWTRREAEQRALAAAEEGVPVAVVRPKTFLGPGAVGAFEVVLRLVLAGATVPVLGPGTNRYQLLDVRDFAAALELLVRVRTTGVYGLGAAQVGTVADELGALTAHAATGARLGFVPAGLARAALRAVAAAGLPPLSEFHHLCAQQRDSVIDISQAQALGWVPEHSGPEALVDSYEALRQDASGASSVHPVPVTHRALATLASLSTRCSAPLQRAAV